MQHAGSFWGEDQQFKTDVFREKKQPSEITALVKKIYDHFWFTKCDLDYFAVVVAALVIPDDMNNIHKYLYIYVCMYSVTSSYS